MFNSGYEFLSVLVCVHIFFIPFLYIYSLTTSIWPLSLIYGLWIYYDKSPFKSGRYSPWLRDISMFKVFANYFPSSVVCDTPLEDKQYMFSYSPHGIIGTGSFCTLGTNGNGFYKHYKRPLRVATIDFNFYMPLFRDIFILLGYLSCAKHTLELNLRQGQSIVVVLGGAQEVQYFDKEHYNVIVDKRYGFFKLALQHGIDIVPVFTFGENDIHKVMNLKNGLFKAVQSFIKNFFGFYLVPFYGQFALIPFRQPMTTVIGNPIKVTQIQDPTEQDVKMIQSLYKEELQHLFNKYQPKYGKHIKTINFVH